MAKRTLAKLGEEGLLTRLAPMLQRHTAGLPLPTGDDVAVSPPPGAGQRLVWTVDAMVEGTHFRFWPAAPGARWLGWKLAASNLSDLASKGARPLGALLSFGAPGDAPEHLIAEFYDGLDECLTAHGARLLGGDTVRAPQWTLSLAVVGLLAEGLPIAARHRARAGQGVYVTGQPGRAAAGLRILEGLSSAPTTYASDLIDAHLRPRPRLAEGQALVAAFPDLAMLDVSDGIVRDGARVADQSGAALHLERDRLPLPAVPPDFGQSALDLFLHGGEDYELLFTTAAPESDAARVLQQIGGAGATRIGTVVEGEGVHLVEADGVPRRLTPKGFEHFP
ncbi:MAG: thiamine-phosphate kinase [Candidatus Sumerlaeia bacterium]|nr:thiamine-phosphate kinase [Candidatus Sumerlaeia bacterium]